MNSDLNNTNLTTETTQKIRFEDLFILEEIQHLQDLFSETSGVASIITHPDGTPITRPSNFCRLCKEIIRKTEKGLSKCYQSDARLGRSNPSGTIIWPCLSAGLWDAGAGITVGGIHIANWMIGQVRNETIEEQKMMQYADEIGVDREEFLKALHEVPVMSLEQFNNIAKMAFAFAKELSEKGYNNLLLKNQILERDKKIKLLQESERKYNSIYENVHEVFYKTDLKGNILEISPSIKYFSDFNRDELIGDSVYNLYDNPNDRENLLNAIMQYSKVSDYELKFRTKTGLIKYVSMNASLIPDENGIPNHLVGAIREKTESKKAEQLLIESEESYRSLFENMLNGFAYCQILYENDTPYDFIYLKVNKSFELLTGLKDVEGKKVSDVISGIQKSDQELIDLYGRVALTGKPEFFEMYVKSLDDWYSISVYSTKKDYFIAVFDVITTRKKNDQELISAKEKAVESDRLKTAFLNNISHEIRTPFNGILGFLSLLQDDELPVKERDDYIGIINQSADRLMNTINEIVEISQIQAGKTELTLEEININALTRDLVNRFGEDATNQGLEFNINNEITSGTGFIMTDLSKLNTVLTNLISNALKFTKNGSITIQTRKNNDFLEFSVKDTGIGISESHKQAIFEKFIQADVSQSRQFEGLGLGLSIAKFYIEILGGTIWLESEEGKGSTFYFTHPYNR